MCNHVRNVPDDVLVRLAENNGVIMVTFVPGYISEETRLHGVKRNEERERLAAMPGSTDESVAEGIAAWNEANPTPPATLAQVADHIDHIRQVIGIRLHRHRRGLRRHFFITGGAGRRLHLSLC